MRAQVRALYESDAPWARRSRDALLTFDIAVVLAFPAALGAGIARLVM